MGFIYRKKTENRGRIPFYKKKAVKAIFVIVGLLLIVGVSFAGYLYATGSKMFDNGNGFTPFIKMIKGEQSNILKDERVNILVLGRGGVNHPGGNLTDSMILVSINTKTNQLAMMNIPRDLYVPIKGHDQAKINEAYADGYNDYLDKNCNKKDQSSCLNDAMAAGANLTRQTVSDVTGVPIQNYVSIDFTGFEKLIDSFGGIDVYVDKAIYDPLYPDKNMKGYDPFYVKVGQQHFDGKTALKYARSRETSSDFDRSRRQQQIFEATKDKAAKLGMLSNPKQLLDIINIVSDHVRTSLSPDDIVALADLSKNIDKQKITNKILSTDASGPLVGDSSSGTYYIKTRTGNFTELQNVVKYIFNTETSEEAKIEVLNGSKISGLGGKLSDALKAQNYNVVNISTTKTSYKKTVIYDYSGGEMKNTLAFLKENLDAEVITKTDTTQKVDISIIIGDNYKGLSIKK